MADAIAIWATADEQIAELNTLAQQVHHRIGAGDTRSPEVLALVARLPALNERLTELEQRFSATLGQASRNARRLVLVGTLVLAIGLAAAGMFLTAYVLRQQTNIEDALRESNERWALAADAAGMGLFEWNLHSGRASLYDLPRRRCVTDSCCPAAWGATSRPLPARTGWSRCSTTCSPTPSNATARAAT